MAPAFRQTLITHTQGLSGYISKLCSWLRPPAWAVKGACPIERHLLRTAGLGQGRDGGPSLSSQ